MNIVILNLLRLVHIFAGALWAGAAVVYLFFIKPSVKSIGPAGPQFMQSLTERRRYPLFMVGVSLLTVVAGGALYLYASGSFNPTWVTSGPGIGFTIGSLAALVAFLVGTFMIGPISARMGALGQQLAGGGPPDSGIIEELHALEKRLSIAENIDIIMLTVSLLTMATARYWVF